MGKVRKTLQRNVEKNTNDDEDGDVKRKIKRENGAEGDLDELDFEEGFADDEEKAEPDNDDEEEKELEVRRKSHSLE